MLKAEELQHDDLVTDLMDQNPRACWKVSPKILARHKMVLHRLLLGLTAAGNSWMPSLPNPYLGMQWYALIRVFIPFSMRGVVTKSFQLCLRSEN